MREKKFLLNWYQSNDTAAMEEKMEKMAEKGWLLERVGSGGWHFRRAEPQKVKYTITYFPAASVFDGGPTEDQETYADYCAAAGWEFVCAYGPMQYFRSTRPDPVPIETDEGEKLSAIHQSMLKTWVLSYGMLLVVWLLNLGLRLSELRRRPLSFLSSNWNIAFLVFLVFFVLYLAAFLLDYFIWYFRSKKAVALGGACLLPHTKARFRASMVMLAVGALMVLAMVSEVSSPGMSWVWVYAFGGMAVMLVLSQGLMALMKKRGCSREATRTAFFVAVVVLAIAYTVGMTAVVTHLRSAGLMAEKQPAYTYQVSGNWSWKIYHDDLPLTLEDLGYTVMVEDHCSYEMEGSRSFLLGYWTCTQQPIPGSGSDLPDLEYDVIEIPWDWLRNYVVERQAAEYAWEETDDPRWGADQVFHTSWYIGTEEREDRKVEQFLLVYGDRIYCFTTGYDQVCTTEQLLAAVRT